MVKTHSKYDFEYKTISNMDKSKLYECKQNQVLWIHEKEGYSETEQLNCLKGLIETYASNWSEQFFGSKSPYLKKKKGMEIHGIAIYVLFGNKEAPEEIILFPTDENKVLERHNVITLNTYLQYIYPKLNFHVKWNLKTKPL